MVTAENAEHRERTASPGKDWEHAGNMTGTPGNIFISRDPPIPPFEPVPLTLPIPHPALRPETSRGTNLVGLRPLRLGLVYASLQDLRNRRALFPCPPSSTPPFPRTASVNPSSFTPY